MGVIRVFKTEDTVFSSDGEIVINPLKAKVHKEDNGSFYLDFECGLEYADYIQPGYILIAPTPQGDQAFRALNPKKTRQKVSVRAKHIFYDTENMVIADVRIIGENCNSALSSLKAGVDSSYVNNFSVLSDVATLNSYYCIRKSFAEAIAHCVELWGGHLVRNNYSIQIRTSIGSDNGVTVRYGKNIKDISVEESWDSVVTKILPVGKDGILLNAVDSSADIYVSSDVSYDIPFTKAITFSQDIEKDQYATEEAYKEALVEDLYFKASEYVNTMCVPRVNYTLKANLEKITDIGDTVEVIDERLGVTLLTNVISYDYDCVLDEYTQVEFGNFHQNLSNLIPRVNSAAEKIATEKVQTAEALMQRELEQATALIVNALGSSFVLYEPNQIFIMDNPDPTLAVNVIRLNSGGIGFSQSGINGTFNSAWTIDGRLLMQNINVLGLVADKIDGGTLNLGVTQTGAQGILKLYDENRNLSLQMDQDGFKAIAQDGSYVQMDKDGMRGFDPSGTEVFWVTDDEFYMKQATVTNEITLCSKLRFIPITTSTNDGIGLISTEV